MIRSILLCVALCASLGAQSLADRSTVSVGVGGETPLGRVNYNAGAGPVFQAGYEFRVGHFFALDAGEDTWLPSGYSFVSQQESVLYGTNLLSYFNGTNPVVVAVPSRGLSEGLHGTMRGILPLADGRLELYVGAGGGYVWHVSGVQAGNATMSVWEAGGRFALDKNRRFWLGLGSRYYTGFSPATRQWLTTSASVGFRFGGKR